MYNAFGQLAYYQVSRLEDSRARNLPTCGRHRLLATTAAAHHRHRPPPPPPPADTPLTLVRLEQSSNLVIVPSRLVASLISVTRWFSWDMYDDMGHWCFDIDYKIITAFSTDDAFTYPFAGLEDANCSNSIALVEDSYASLGQLDALKAIANTTMLNSDLNCGGAVNLNFTFLLFNYLFFGLTCYLIVILILGDRNIRQKVRRLTDDLKCYVFNILLLTCCNMLSMPWLFIVVGRNLEN